MNNWLPSPPAKRAMTQGEFILAELAKAEILSGRQVKRFWP
ncbi:hypothetical protein [Thiobacillus sp. 65-1402]|nr:hypothetical protein [Thiobacillus sp. 65-1402]